MIKKHYSNQARLRRHQRVRKKVSGTAIRPRLAVFRSNDAIYAQVIDDTIGQTLLAANSREPEFKQTQQSLAPMPEEDVPQSVQGLTKNRRVVEAWLLGQFVAQRAKAQGITQVVFDRGGYIYHGRVAAVAEGARHGGLDF